MTLRRRTRATTAPSLPESPSLLDTRMPTMAILQPSSPFLSLSPCLASLPLPFSKPPTTILQLPFEILVGQVFAILELTDLARLARVSRGFLQFCQTDYLWQKKFFLDFEYRPTKIMRPFGWKRLYQAMDRVELYTWGKRNVVPKRKKKREKKREREKERDTIVLRTSCRVSD